MAAMTFELRSGRRVGVTTLGNPDADRIVVVCHSAPGSSTFDPDPDISATRDAHIIAIDRPGYGSSDPWPPASWPSITRAADDIAEYIRSLIEAEAMLGVDRPRTVGVAGWSAGGRVALALAAWHPELVDRVAVIATPAPNEAVPWIDPGLQALSDDLGKRSPSDAMRQLSDMLQGQADAVRHAEALSEVPLGPLTSGPIDDQVLEGRGVRDRLAMMLKDAFRQGPGGVAGDILSYTARPWGFELADVRARTLVISGEGDAIAGSAHAAWYQRALPDARMEVVPGVGHLVVVPAWERVLSHLAPAGVRR
ncbi:alpha/beta fold hydrolase [Leifsonia sp. AG29]|uniref:alpha/beta fold hydrolase n=1 Tax=Leifsonia sp. AG29 TaxID=2598860 RepID=UPI00131D11FF|nr:alpha/beta fold hydrolase [Leifsonia sp. AG29]